MSTIDIKQISYDYGKFYVKGLSQQGGGGSGNVNSVNGQTGDVVLSAVDVDALPSNTLLFSGDYNDLANKPTIPAEQIQSDWNQTNNSSKDFIKNKPTIPEVPTNVSAFTNDAGYLTQHQDISGKADKSEMSVTDGTGANSDKTTIQLKSGTSAIVLKSHQSLKTINNESILGSGNITIQGGGSAYVPILNSAPTSSTTTYTKDGQTVDFEIGQFARVAKQGGGYDFYQLYDLTTSNNVTIATWEKVEQVPDNVACISNDSGEGIIPQDGIRAETITSASAMTVNPDVVTVVTGAVGTASITLQVPQDNLAHVWDILMTTDSTVAITFAMSNSATILYPDGFSVGASKAVEISVIGVGTKYYLRYGEFA